MDGQSLVRDGLALGLAVVFGSAAIGKGGGRAAFVQDLEEILGKFGRPAAFVVIALEAVLAIALMTALIVGATRPMLAAAGAAALFLIGASFYIALRLVVTRSSECRCWGGGVGEQLERLDELPVEAGEHAIGDILRPAWYATRNAVLVAGAVVLALLSGLAVPTPVSVFASALPICLIAGGLMLSIRHEHQLLSAPEHPLVMVISPRARILVAQLARIDNLLPAFASRVTVLRRVDADESTPTRHAVGDESQRRRAPLPPNF